MLRDSLDSGSEADDIERDIYEKADDDDSRHNASVLDETTG